jgi:hypothetical protein
MEKEYSVWWQDQGEPLVLTKEETKSLTNKSRLLAQFNSFDEAYAYSKNLDESGTFQGNIAFPQTGHKDNNGYYFLTQLHLDDVVQTVKDTFEDIDSDYIKNQLTDDVMRKIAEDIVDNLLNDLYWTSIVSTLESELPDMMEELREREI